jgi:hypothetical protein
LIFGVLALQAVLDIAIEHALKQPPPSAGAKCASWAAFGAELQV